MSSSDALVQTQQNGVVALNAIQQTLSKVFPQASGTSGSAIGGAATLPANPVGFVTVTLPGVGAVKIPYYT